MCSNNNNIHFFLCLQLHSLLLLCSEDLDHYWRTAWPDYCLWNHLPDDQLLCRCLCLFHHDWSGELKPQVRALEIIFMGYSMAGMGKLRPGARMRPIWLCNPPRQTCPNYIIGLCFRLYFCIIFLYFSIFAFMRVIYLRSHELYLLLTCQILVPIVAHESKSP